MSLTAPLSSLSIGDAAGPRHRPHFLARRRYQLIGAVLFAVVIPALLQPRFNIVAYAFNHDATIFGTFGAVVLGAYLLRRMTSFPGVSIILALVPAIGAAYAAAALGFFLTRFDYSRSEFLISLAAALLWFAFVGIVSVHVKRPRLLLVPSGHADNLLSSTQADWAIARSTTELPPGIQGVVADLRSDLSPEWERLLAHAALDGLPVYHWKQVAESLTGMVNIEHLSENNLGSLLPSSIYLRFKHVIDVVLAVVALPAVLLMIGATALAILISDGRPVFFKQQRTGFRGKQFVVWKLRTMRINAASGSAFTEADDERVFGAGKFLRKYRFDELPQIFNILRGEMSWIGPRPESQQLADWYAREVPFYSYRHIVRPGITGWAQVNQGNVAEVKAATSKLRYDFYYIKYFSPWLDLLIAARTIRTLLTGFGSR